MKARLTPAADGISQVPKTSKITNWCIQGCRPQIPQHPFHTSSTFRATCSVGYLGSLQCILHISLTCMICMSDFQLQESSVMFHLYVVLPGSQSILRRSFYKFRTMIMGIF